MLRTLGVFLSVCATAAEPTAVSRSGMTLGGKPFFPWGVYMQEATAEQLSDVRASGFNTILSYEHGPDGLPVDGTVTSHLPVVGNFLDRAAAADLRVFYAMNGFFSFPPYNEPRGENWTTSVVSTFKDHEAIAAWYTVDERPVQYLPQMRARHELVRKLDPGHVTFAVLEQASQIASYTEVSETLGAPQSSWPKRPVRAVPVHPSPLWTHAQVWTPTRGMARYRTT